MAKENAPFAPKFGGLKQLPYLFPLRAGQGPIRITGTGLLKYKFLRHFSCDTLIAKIKMEKDMKLD